MEITGKVLIIEANATIAGQKGTYIGTELTYKDSSGITKAKAFHSNALKFNAALKNGLDNLKAGDDFTATLEKKDEFWNWISIVKGIGAVNNNDSKPSVSTPYVNKATPSTYATAEERAQTQKYIVRQSSITAALKLTEVRGDKKTNVGEILQLASQFEEWVYGNNQADVPEATADIADMEDDIPY